MLCLGLALKFVIEKKLQVLAVELCGARKIQVSEVEFCHAVRLCPNLVMIQAYESLFHFHGHFLGSDSQCQSNRGVRAAELSWEQTTSTPELDIQGPARAAGAGWRAPALLASSLCIQFLFPTSQCWHQVEFPQQCS